MSKIQSIFEINLDHYLLERNKLIYTENRVTGKALQHLKPSFQLNFITFFNIIKDLFNYLKDIFGNFYQKKRAIEKFRELKIGANLFSGFYSKFI